MIKNLALIVLMTVSSYVFAGAGSGNGKITQMHIDALGTRVRINFSEPIVNPEGCQKAEFYMLELNDSNSSSRYVAALLSAYTAEKTVYFWISGCTTGQYWGGTRPQLHDIYLK